MKEIKHVLEIYEPGSAVDCWVAFESGSAFQSISIGDIVNPGPWTDTTHPTTVAKVTAVEHLVFETDRRITHKKMVYCESVENAPGLRAAI